MSSPRPQMRLSAELRELRELIDRQHQEGKQERAMLRDRARRIEENAEVLLDALNEAIARMGRARKILCEGGGNWGMLDTEKMKEAIAKVEVNS